MAKKYAIKSGRTEVTLTLTDREFLTLYELTSFALDIDHPLYRLAEDAFEELPPELRTAWGDSETPLTDYSGDRIPADYLADLDEA